MPVVAVVDQLADAEALAPEWDALAVGAAEPLSTPAWMLGWWRHAAPPGGALHVLTVRDGDRLIGLAPLWKAKGAGGSRRFAFLAGGDFSSSVALPAVAGREREVAVTVGAALAESVRSPDLIEIGPLVAADASPAALAEGWTRRPRPLLLRRAAISAPVVDLTEFEDFDAWLAARGRSFRSNFRRRTRWLEEAGGSFRQCSAETVDEDIATFVRLHTDRWRDLGTSRMVAMGDDLTPMLTELAHELGPGDRFRLYLLEVDQEPIAVSFYIEAGGEAVLINTGWDDAHHRLAPLQLLMGHAIRDCLARGNRRLSLGHGASRAKLSVADADEPVVEAAMFPLGPRTPLAMLDGRTFLRRWVQDHVRAALPDETYDRLRALKRRLEGARRGSTSGRTGTSG
jgi:CelD/BcsL family acetyltransferase involved in cellulose biosynthesis